MGVVLLSSTLGVLLGEFVLATNGRLVAVFNWMPRIISWDHSGSLALPGEGGELDLHPVLTGGNFDGECLEGTVGFKPVRIRDIVYRVKTALSLTLFVID